MNDLALYESTKVKAKAYYTAKTALGSITAAKELRDELNKLLRRARKHGVRFDGTSQD